MSSNSKLGHFIISLDFELHWGSFDKHPLDDDRKTYYLNTRKAINEILSIFEEYNIHATWASVGFLFHENKEVLLTYTPNKIPDYHNSTLSPYLYIKKNLIGNNEAEDPFHFAASLMDSIKATPFQEIATHSYSHFYCNEKGATAEAFDKDLKMAISVASKFNISLKSMVFARNQFNTECLKICNENGIVAVRSNPEDWWWKINSTVQESPVKRFFRGADAYFPLGKKTSYSISKIDSENLPVLIPASGLLRPYRGKDLLLNRLKINRIKNEMSVAAKSHEVYHLWWHPHNFGYSTSENLRDLKIILDHFKHLNNKFNFQSLNMAEITDRILKPEHVS
jgi:hypothetical protein